MVSKQGHCLLLCSLLHVFIMYLANLCYFPKFTDLWPSDIKSKEVTLYISHFSIVGHFQSLSQPYVPSSIFLPNSYHFSLVVTEACIVNFHVLRNCWWWFNYLESMLPSALGYNSKPSGNYVKRCKVYSNHKWRQLKDMITENGWWLDNGSAWQKSNYYCKHKKDTKKPG